MSSKIIRCHTSSPKRSFDNIRGLGSIFFGCESLLESKSPDTLSLFETNLDDSIGSVSFFMRVYLPLIQKGSVIHMHGLAIYVKEGLSFTGELSLGKLCGFLFMFFTGFTLFSVLILFPLSMMFSVFINGF